MGIPRWCYKRGNPCVIEKKQRNLKNVGQKNRLESTAPARNHTIGVLGSRFTDGILYKQAKPLEHNSLFSIKAGLAVTNGLQASGGRGETEKERRTHTHTNKHTNTHTQASRARDSGARADRNAAHEGGEDVALDLRAGRRLPGA